MCTEIVVQGESIIVQNETMSFLYISSLTNNSTKFYIWSRTKTIKTITKWCIIMKAPIFELFTFILYEKSWSDVEFNF
jgi:hypothetical protein